MKVFLFLYPVRQFFSDRIETSPPALREGNHNPGRISDIIDARYRQRGYAINWLMFSTNEDPEKPDLSIVSSYIKICEEDTILVAGVSFKEHLIGEKYPDPLFILAQIPDLTELVLGGFHQWDCVDKLAQCAHQRGILTLVDEDTTEMFFARTFLCGEVPLIRGGFTLSDLGIREDMIEFARAARENKPWFVQI